MKNVKALNKGDELFYFEAAKKVAVQAEKRNKPLKLEMFAPSTKKSKPS